MRRITLSLMVVLMLIGCVTTTRKVKTRDVNSSWLLQDYKKNYRLVKKKGDMVHLITGGNFGLWQISPDGKKEFLTNFFASVGDTYVSKKDGRSDITITIKEILDSHIKVKYQSITRSKNSKHGTITVDYGEIVVPYLNR